MGRMIGAFDDTGELDRADLNKCPDCGCFFPQDECPICGMVCPEEMRAGKRIAVKKKKKKRGSASSRNVTFIDWYHSWWFIILMLIFFPFVGIILLVTSPHKKSAKIAVAAIAVVYTLFTTYGFGTVIKNRIVSIWDKPVDTSMSREEYIAACEVIPAEEYYRNAEIYNEKFVSVTLTVREKITDADAYYENGNYTTYYVCTDADGGEYEIMIRDCVQDSSKNYISGDVITVYGEGTGNSTVYDMNYETHTAPCINVAYIEEQGE